MGRFSSLLGPRFARTLAPAAWHRECLPCPWEGGRGGSYNPERVSSGRESFGSGDHRVSLLSWPSETGDGSRAFANVQHPVISGDSAWLGHSADLSLSLAGNPGFWKVGVK